MSQPVGLRLVAGTQMQRSKRPIRSTEGRLLACLHISRLGGDHLDLATPGRRRRRSAIRGAEPRVAAEFEVAQIPLHPTAVGASVANLAVGRRG